MTTPRFLLDCKFRSNTGYELIEWNRLSQSEQDALAGLKKDAEVYGLFRPVHADARLTYKVASQEGALLYYTLQQQEILPAYTRIDQNTETNEKIARLVLEGVLEIEWQQNYLTGPAAHPAIYEDTPSANTLTASSTPAPVPSFIADLSRQALQHAIQLDTTDTHGIAARLYNYNTQPAFPDKLATLQSTPDIEQFLGIAEGSSYSLQLTRHWQRHAADPDSKWMSWTRRGPRKNHNPRDPTYKMYLSPHWQSLPKLLARSLKILSASPAFSFKIGNDPHGLLRPDKMVVYFHDYNALRETAAALATGLAGVQPHGVPFTAQLDDQGLLSWGVDPPGAEIVENFEGGSWRARVTDRLASAIVQSKAAGFQRREILQYALDRVALEGMDTATWTPQQHIWQ